MLMGQQGKEKKRMASRKKNQISQEGPVQTESEKLELRWANREV